MAPMEGLKQLVAGKIRDYTLPAIVGKFTPLRLFRSSDGGLWIGTIRGLLHLYKGRIDRFSAADGLSGDLVTSILEDREGSVWVGTSTGLDRFRAFADANSLGEPGSFHCRGRRIAGDIRMEVFGLPRQMV